MNDTHDQDCAVDFTRLREVTGNDEQLFADIIAQYLAQAEQTLVELEAAVEDEDQVRASQFAHKLAGSSATCGMNAIVGPLQSLENLQPYVNSEAVKLVQECRLQFERVQTALSQAPSSEN